jgi:hypothetical protein
VFDGEFRLTVRINRRSRIRFPNRRFERFSVHGARGRKDELTTFLRGHRLERRQRAAHVVLVIADRIAHGIGYHQPRRKMHDGRCAAVAQGTADGIDVADIALDEGGVERGLPGVPRKDCRR